MGGNDDNLRLFQSAPHPCGYWPDREARDLVLDILQADLEQELDRRLAAHRQAIVSVLEGWWEKYRVTLSDILAERQHATEGFGSALRELGYMGQADRLL